MVFSHAVRSMDLLGRLFDIARPRNRKIVLPEGEDERIIARQRACKDELAQPILLGDAGAIATAAGGSVSRWTASTLAIRAAMRACTPTAPRLRDARETMTPAMAGGSCASRSISAA